MRSMQLYKRYYSTSTVHKIMISLARNTQRKPITVCSRWRVSRSNSRTVIHVYYFSRARSTDSQHNNNNNKIRMKQKRKTVYSMTTTKERYLKRTQPQSPQLHSIDEDCSLSSSKLRCINDFPASVQLFWTTRPVSFCHTIHSAILASLLLYLRASSSPSACLIF